MKSVHMVCVLCTLVLPGVSLGSDVTDLVQKGLDAYRSYGAKPALRAWEYEGVKEDALVDRLSLLRKTLGVVHGSEIGRYAPARSAAEGPFKKVSSCTRAAG